MVLRKLLGAVVLTAGLLAATVSSATATTPTTATTATTSTTAASAAMTAADPMDAEFTEMMIPHHYQALVLSDLTPTRSSDTTLKALANRIHLEQGLEIKVMQGWQSRNGVPVTDAAMSYEMMLDDPDMLAEMGMASRADIAELKTLSGNAFDVRWLQLMITHHEGAIRMLVDVLVTTIDPDMMQMASDMYATQESQLNAMDQMLATKTG